MTQMNADRCPSGSSVEQASIICAYLRHLRPKCILSPLRS